MRGRNKKWAKDFILSHQELLYDASLDNSNLKTLEVGIGKGDFIIANAKNNPDYLHIGVEINESIFAVAMKKIVNEQINNIRLLNIKALDLANFIKDNSISKLYLNFSDPWPQNGYRKRRLVHPIHLEIFEKLLVDGGFIYFKTDNLPLFEMGLRNFQIRNYQIIDVSYDYQLAKDDYLTEYENKFRLLNMPIYRVVVQIFKNNLNSWQDANK